MVRQCTKSLEGSCCLFIQTGNCEGDVTSETFYLPKSLPTGDVIFEARLFGLAFTKAYLKTHLYNLCTTFPLPFVFNCIFNYCRHYLFLVVVGGEGKETETRQVRESPILWAIALTSTKFARPFLLPLSISVSPLSHSVHILKCETR